jgi:hypothetical protein
VYFLKEGKLNQVFKKDFKELKELAKARRNTTKRKNTALYKLEELIKEALSNRLTKAFKYIKANYLNVGYIY